jgi:hypothetical protein
MDNQLDIEIRTHADLDAARETVAELKELKRQAIAAGVSTGDLDKQIGLAEAAERSATKSLAKGAEESGHHIGGLHKAVGLLTRQFGELGHLAHFGMASLQAFAVAALALAIGEVTSKFLEWKKAIEEVSQNLEKMNRIRLESLSQTVRDARSEIGKLNADLAAAGSPADPMKERFDRRAKERAAAGLPAEGPEVELGQRSKEQHRLQAEAEAAITKASAARNDPRLLEAQRQIEFRQQKQEELDAKESEMRERYESSRAANGEAGGLTPQLKEGYEKFKDKAEEGRAEIERAKNLIVPLQVVADEAAAQARFRSGAAVANKKRISDLAGTTRDTEAGLIGTGTASVLEDAQELVRRHDAGAKLNQPEKEFIRTIATVGSGNQQDDVNSEKFIRLTAINENTKNTFLNRILNAMEKTGGINQGLDSKLTRLEQEMAQLRTRLDGMPQR